MADRCSAVAACIPECPPPSLHPRPPPGPSPGWHRYELYLELSKRFVLAARRRVKTSGSNLLVSTDSNDITRDSPSCVAKVQATAIASHPQQTCVHGTCLPACHVSSLGASVRPSPTVASPQGHSTCISGLRSSWH